MIEIRVGIDPTNNKRLIGWVRKQAREGAVESLSKTGEWKNIEEGQKVTEECWLNARFHDPDIRHKHVFRLDITSEQITAMLKLPDGCTILNARMGPYNTIVLYGEHDDFPTNRFMVANIEHMMHLIKGEENT